MSKALQINVVKPPSPDPIKTLGVFNVPEDPSDLLPLLLDLLNDEGIAVTPGDLQKEAIKALKENTPIGATRYYLSPDKSIVSLHILQTHKDIPT